VVLPFAGGVLRRAAISRRVLDADVGRLRPGDRRVDRGGGGGGDGGGDLPSVAETVGGTGRGGGTAVARLFLA